MLSVYNYEKSTVRTLSGGIEIEIARESRNDAIDITFIPYKQIRSVRYNKKIGGCCEQMLSVLVNDTWFNIQLDCCEAVNLYNTIKDSLAVCSSSC